ncbi:MAG: RNA repair domain-containing protein [Methanobacterium sp.]|nr:RNA repair domain-containing protein [Methanobacterium sp.]
MARNIINMILWHPGLDINETIITYIHRGVVGNIKQINGNSIDRIERGFLILVEGTQIPYHRIVKIENKNKILYKK